jgi:hypothetical protein
MTAQAKIPPGGSPQSQDIAAVTACLTGREHMTALGYALVMGRLRADLRAYGALYPDWRLWLSDTGHVYGTGPNPAGVPGALMTVDAATPRKLIDQIELWTGRAERYAARTALFRAMAGAA